MPSKSQIRLRLETPSQSTTLRSLTSHPSTSLFASSLSIVECLVRYSKVAHSGAHYVKHLASCAVKRLTFTHPSQASNGVKRTAQTTTLE